MSKWREFHLTRDVRLPTGSGCYAIYYDGELVYVGMAANVASRISGAHTAMPDLTEWGTGRMSAARGQMVRRIVVKVRLCRFFGERATLELRLLRRLRPRLNRINNPDAKRRVA